MPHPVAFTALSLPIEDPVLIVAIAIGIFLLAPLLVERLHLPGIVGLILAGALVGPNALGLLARSSTIILLGTVGLLYLMFMAGVEIDLHGFKRYRNRSLIFGAITFFLPQLIGTAVALGLGYGWATSILIASMFASHTLLAYPIAVRFGIAKTQAVTTAVGGTIITDTAALLVLAVVAASTRGALDAAFWIRLVVLLSLYVVAIWYGLPWIARWFFRHEKTGAGTEYLFVLAALFGGSYLAEVAGVEAIVGAFLVGLSLNRLIPEHSLLSNRLHFFGETFFIPFFLLSVGMLVDVRVLAGSTRAWTVMIAMTVTVTATKWLAAKATEKLFGYSPEEGWTIFGLSVAQAAATLAAALVGVEIGLLDDAVLNGVILMILVTVVIGPLAVERYGRRLALREQEKPYKSGEAPQRILVPMANPASADALMDLALVIRHPDSDEPIYPLTVVPAEEDRAAEHVALAEKMLSHAVAYASGVGVPVVPLTRVDHNFANGITRGITETRTSCVVIGWDGRRQTSWGIFGSVLDQLLERTRQQVMVAKLGHPLNTTERLVVLIPEGADHVPGFFDAVRTLKLMASRLGASIVAYAVNSSPDLYRELLHKVKPEVPLTVERAGGWSDALKRLEAVARPDDLVVVLSARRGAVSWSPILERLPGRLAQLNPESFVMLYPSEVPHETAVASAGALLFRTPLPRRVLLHVPRAPYPEIIRKLLAMAFPADLADPAEREEIAEGLIRNEAEFTTEICPGVVVPHARISGLAEPLLLLATSPEGVEFPRADGPAHLIFVLLTPEDDAGEHLRQLAGIARLVSDPESVRALVGARSDREIKHIIRAEADSDMANRAG